jgi:hypothetical protein
VAELEAAFSEAAPGREAWCREAVLRALTVLEEATTDEAANAQSPDRLLSDLSHNHPGCAVAPERFGSSTPRSATRSRHCAKNSKAPRTWVPTTPTLRERLGCLLTALRHQPAREWDLIYEAYYDAFHVDLRIESGKGTP